MKRALATLVSLGTIRVGNASYGVSVVASDMPGQVGATAVYRLEGHKGVFYVTDFGAGNVPGGAEKIPGLTCQHFDRFRVAAGGDQ